MALAWNGVSPAGGDGEGRAGGVHVQQSIAVDRSCAGGGVGIGRVVGLVVERETGAARHRCVGGYLVAVVEEEARTDSKTFTEWVNVESGSGGLHGKTGVGADSAGSEVGGIVEDVAGGSQVEMRVEVGGHRELDPERRESSSEGDLGKRTSGQSGGGRSRRHSGVAGATRKGIGVCVVQRRAERLSHEGGGCSEQDSGKERSIFHDDRTSP